MNSSESFIQRHVDWQSAPRPPAPLGRFIMIFRQTWQNCLTKRGEMQFYLNVWITARMLAQQITDVQQKYFRHRRVRRVARPALVQFFVFREHLMASIERSSRRKVSFALQLTARISEFPSRATQLHSINFHFTEPAERERLRAGH